MVQPSELSPHYLFNPWMRWNQRVDLPRARQQWRRLVDLIVDAGGQVLEGEPSPEEATGAITFTADGALVYDTGRAVLLDNDGPRGTIEPAFFRRSLQSVGLQVEGTPYRLDGGNVVAGGPSAWLIGSKPGSDGRGERYLGKLLKRLIGAQCYRVPLVDERFLHLDMAFSCLGGYGFLYLPSAFPDDGKSLVALPPLQGLPVLAVTESDAICFACNTVLVGENLITGPISRRLQDQLRDLGLRVATANLDEFYKAGGGAKCLTLALSAPTWRNGGE